MISIFDQIDSAALALTIIGAIWGIEQMLGNIARDALESYNTKVLRTIQTSYDQTDVLQPLLRKKYDMSGLSVTLLCDTMISTFNLSFLLWMSIKIAIFAQHSNFLFVKITCLHLANVFLWYHSLVYDEFHSVLYGYPTTSVSFDLEWSELTVKIAIQELCSPGLFGDGFLMILYDISQFKSGPLACKLPFDKNPTTTCDNKVSLAELLVTAFALYNVDGSQVIEKQDINVLGLATVMFECVDEMPSFVTISLSINEIMLQFSINATAQCQQDSKGAWDAAYLIQYAIATDNQWLLRASKDRINHIVDVPHTEDIKTMAYAAGSAIALHSRRTYPEFKDNQYWDWIFTHFTDPSRLPWCQHHTSSFRKCHCWLTRFLIMSPETAAKLYDLHDKRSIIVVANNEDEGAHILETETGKVKGLFVRLSHQSEIITNSTQFQRTNRIILVGATEKKSQMSMYKSQVQN
ncbi:unnamed protein product [Absidia cylindrospora]